MGYYPTFSAVRFKLRQFGAEIFRARGQVGELVIDELLPVVGGVLGGGDFLLRGLALLHQLDLLVFDVRDLFLAVLDLVGERALLVNISSQASSPPHPDRY